MRTTIRLDDHLLREAKGLALRSGRTLTKVIEDALREALARGSEAPTNTADRVSLPTFTGDGLLPGVDLDDSAGLIDLMERRDDPR